MGICPICNKDDFTLDMPVFFLTPEREQHANIYFDFQRKKAKTDEQRAGVERAIRILKDKICVVGAQQKQLENVGSFLGWWDHYFFHIFE